MSIDRIAAIAALPMAGRAGESAMPPRFAPGQIIRLTLDAVGADEVLATTMEGMQLRLQGADRLPHGLTPGAPLQLRVLSAAPRLELGWTEAPAPKAAGHGEPLTAAMRGDQLALLRQVSAPPHDAAALAATWRRMAESYFARHAVRFLPMLELLLPDGARTSGFPAGEQVDPWLPAFYGVHRAFLSVPHGMEEEDEAPPQKRRQRAALAVLLEAVLPGIGHVTIQIQLAGDEVLLDVYGEESARTPMRALLPQLVAAAGRTGLRAARCRLLHHAPRDALDGLHTQRAPSPVLFHAAAEVALLLASLASPAPISPACR